MAGTLSEIRHEILRVELKIEDFLSLQPESVGSFHKSSTFRFSDFSWQLIVYPYGEEKFKDSIGLYLKPVDLSSSLTAVFTLAVKKTDGSLIVKNLVTWKFQSSSYGYPQVLLKSDLLQKKDEFLHEGALTFCCILQKLPPTEVMDALSLDLKKLRMSSAQSDVTVQLKSREYRAHRAILAARSNVFESALKHDMSEKETGVIKIEDCDADSFGEFLQHLYTGRADINEDNVYHLFRTADKYLVAELKSHCIAFLMENMSVDIFFGAITLADDYKITDLKGFCKNFFRDNAGSILATSDWTSLMRNHCAAADDLLKHLAPNLPVIK